MKSHKAILGTLLTLGLLLGNSCSTLMTPSSLISETPDAVVDMKDDSPNKKLSKKKNKKKQRMMAKQKRKNRKARKTAAYYNNRY